MNGRTSRRAKALDIPKHVKEIVWERDGGACVLCGRTDSCLPSAHYISRGQAGLGIEQNIVTLCTDFAGGCHSKYDNGTLEERNAIGAQLREYLRLHYPDWDEDELIYRR